MEVLEAIKTRKSIRKFENKVVPDDLLIQIVEAGRWAPSWSNYQPWSFVIVTDPAVRDELAKTDQSPSKPCVGAPAIIAICGERGKSGSIKGELVTELGDQWFLFDLGLATQNMSLAAHALGLGSVIVGWFDMKRAREILEVPEDKEVVALLPVGYPAATPPAKGRKELAEIVYKNKYGKS